MHVSPRATEAQDMEHPVQKPAVIMGWSRFAATLGRQQPANHRPLLVRQIAPRQAALQKTALNQN
jgi:hypothetical protein